MSELVRELQHQGFLGVEQLTAVAPIRQGGHLCRRHAFHQRHVRVVPIFVLGLMTVGDLHDQQLAQPARNGEVVAQPARERRPHLGQRWRPGHHSPHVQHRAALLHLLEDVLQLRVHSVCVNHRHACHVPASYDLRVRECGRMMRAIDG